MKEYMRRLKSGGTVLDVGCAGGRDSKKLVGRGFKVIGIDLVDSFLKIARKKYLKLNLLKWIC
jgi:2-polyprenyl-3-methyl-5-hydroxy-6-metoxy-1,4-benzoquinol methylase